MSSSHSDDQGTHREKEEDEKDDIVEFLLQRLHDRPILFVLLVVPLWPSGSCSALVAVAVGRLGWVWLRLSIRG